MSSIDTKHYVDTVTRCGLCDLNFGGIYYAKKHYKTQGHRSVLAYERHSGNQVTERFLEEIEPTDDDIKELKAFERELTRMLQK